MKDSKTRKHLYFLSGALITIGLFGLRLIYDGIFPNYFTVPGITFVFIGSIAIFIKNED